MFSWGNYSLKRKFVVMQTIVFILAFVPFVFLIVFLMQSNIDKELKRQLEQVSVLVDKNFSIIAEQIVTETTKSYNIFESMIEQNYGKKHSNSWSINTQNTINIKDKTTFDLSYNGYSVTNMQPILDYILTMTKSVGTIFIKDIDGDFVRIATSLRDTNGNLVVGTNLGKNHPAFQKINNKEIFTGRVRLFGYDYMSIYAPVLSASNEVIGILFVAYQLEDFYRALKNSLSQIPIGAQGGILVLDKKFNKFIVGDSEQLDDRSYFANPPENDFIVYSKDGKHYKTFGFYNKPLEVYVLVEAVIEDFTKTIVVLQEIIVAALLAIVVIVLLLLSFAIGKLLSPLSTIQKG
uniref:Cache 3/Cache 2 fusion domain-containing protein n=1 Tax=Helicobacter mesocricetorum TaxID=87012 RepID=UPI0013151477